MIYMGPTDYPGQFVVRRWTVNPGGVFPDPRVIACMTLEEARAAVPEGLYCLTRAPDDDPAIFEIWI